MLIKLEQRHIDNGIRCQCDTCPWALAMNEATGKVWFVGRVAYAQEGSSDAGRLPNSVIDWIERYDHGEKVEPMEAEIEV